MALIGQEHIIKIHFLSNEQVTSQHKDLTCRHHYLTSQNNCPKRRIFSNYVDLSDHYAYLSENYVDLSDYDVDLSDNVVDLSDIKLTSRRQLVALT